MSTFKDEKTNTWCCQFYYTDWNGKRKHTTKRGFKRKRDAEQYEMSCRWKPTENDITVGMLVNMYTSHLKQRVKLGTLKPTTYDRYKALIRLYIVPYFPEDLQVKDISTEAINQWLISLMSYTSDHTQRPLKTSSISTAKTQLCSMFNYATRRKLLSANPIRDAERLPVSQKKNIAVWTLEQYNIFYNSLKKEQHRLAFNLMFFCGMRIGEVLALTPADINDDCTISVHHTLAWVESKKVLLSPKTPSSERTISVPQFVFDQLMNYVSHIYDCKADTLLFNVGRKNFANLLEYHAKKNNLPHMTPHGLRHSSASILLKLTGDIAMVAQRLGHKNSKVTLQVYAHMLPGADREASNILNKLALSTNGSDAIDVDGKNINSK